MADDFKIYGRGAGLGQGFSRPGSGLERFKRGRRAGDLVRGIFLRLEAASPGTAWVKLEGEELLAQLPENLQGLARSILAAQGVGADPGGPTERDFPLQHGDSCFFVLEALEPEPLLRMLPHALRPGQEPDAKLRELLAGEQLLILWRQALSLPLAQLAARYLESRRRLDALLRARLWPGRKAGDAEGLVESGQAGANPDVAALRAALEKADWQNPAWLRQNEADLGQPQIFPVRPEDFPALGEFTAFLERDGEAAELYGNLRLYSAGLTHHFRARGLRAIHYLPWLQPGTQGLEAAWLYLAQGRAEPVLATLLLCRQPEGGGVDLRFSAGSLSPQLKVWPPPGRDLPDLLLALMPPSSLTGGGFSRRA